MSATLFRLPIRTVLVADGLLCLAMGAGLVALRTPLSGPTGLGESFLGAAGALLLPVGAFILAVAAGRVPFRVGLGVVVAGNLGWSIASVLLPVLGLVAPTPLGWGLMFAQAGGVALLAVLEARGFDRGGAFA